MSFSWLETARPPVNATAGATRHAQVAAAELVDRAGLLYRLGFTEAAATARLRGRVAWEHEGRHRPDSLSDTAIAKLVADTYARRPG